MRGLVTLLLLAAPAAAQWLYAPQPVSTGDLPHRVAAGDLNGDGAADLVTQNAGGNLEPPATLTVMLGDGGGAFGGAVTFPIVAAANAMQLGDVTGDGDLDVVTVATALQQVAVHPGNGLGGFTAPTTAPTGGASLCLTLADLDLDGALDVFAGNGTQDTVSHLAGDGAGGLLPAVLVPVDNTAQALFVEPIDGDALPDLLVLGSATLSVRLFPGTGGGALGPKQIVLATSGLFATLADMNGDGRLDYVSARDDATFSGPDLVETALNDGTGHFTLHAQVSIGRDTRGLGAGDFDLDGAVDVVASCEDDRTLNLLLGDGTGGLLTGTWIPMEDSPAALVVAELSGDGRPDVAVVTPGLDSVHVLLANSGRLRFGAPTSTSAGNGPASVVLGDLDDDGKLDAVTAVYGKDVIARMLGDGAGDFLLKKEFAAGDGPRDPRLADMDLDGDLDVAYALGNTPTALAILPGLGNGNFGPKTTFATTSATFLVAATDVDGDLVPDLLATVSSPPQAQFWRGDGAGGVLAPVSWALPAAPAGAAGDLDGDAVADLLLTFSATQEVATLLGDGAGQFTLGPPIRTGWFARLPAVADVDGDGLADGLAVTGSHGEAGATVALLRGAGGGALLPPQHVAMREIYSIAAGDLNGDGRADVAGAGLHSVPTGDPITWHLLYVLEGGEDGLLPPSVVANDIDMGGLALADLTGDGRAEIVAVGPLTASPNLSAPHPWHDHDHALAGVHGEPALLAIGWAQAGTPGVLRLIDAAPAAPAVLFVSPFGNPTPFKGGVLYPVPPAIAMPLVTDAHGRIELAWSSWPALGTGSTYWLQAGIADAAAPKGVSLSKALQLIQP